MTRHVQVVIVGGGIVGCSVLYWLSRLGWTDILLLERRELTSGSTWHAAGNVTHFGHYPSITRLYTDSIATYLDAEGESRQSVSFHKAGSLRLATKPEELEAYHRLKAMYDDLGVAYEVRSPAELGQIHPLLNTDGLLGAAHTPGDGHVDPTGATHALAKAARARGAVIARQAPLKELASAGTGWVVRTNEEEIHTDHIVLAASFWTKAIAAQIGLDLPLYPLEHHEVVTDRSANLAALDFEVPTVRDPAAPSNTRQEGHGYLCGVYESNPKFWALSGIPEDFTEELLPPDLDRLEPHLLKVIDRIPDFGDSGIKTINNGPICYTPDGCPLLGPVSDRPGLWLATGFCVGIGTGGGSGSFLAHWMTEGEPPYDLGIVHPSRFNGSMSQTDALESIRKTYRAGYPVPKI